MGIRLTYGPATHVFPSGPVTVGREAESDFRVEAEGTAPRHAVLREVQGKWLIESVCDQALTVGDGRPTRLAWLGSGDRIRIGPSGPVLLFEMAATGPAAAPLASASAPTSVPRGSAPPSRPSRRIPPWVVITGGLAAGLLVALLAWRSPPAGASAVASSPVTSSIQGSPGPGGTTGEEIGSATLNPPTRVTPVAESETTGTQSSSTDPADFVVLVGIADFASDSRPHLLGVGWLWNDRTVIVPRVIGETLTAIINKTRERGQPRSGCVICGLPLAVESIAKPREVPEISVLTLAEPADVSAEPKRQWRKVGAGDVQRLRERREPLQYVSYARLPRPESVKGKHDFSLIAYDPEAVSVVTAEPKFEYEERRHILKPDETNPLERGGLITDRQGRIMGMVLLDAQVLWSADLERGLADLPDTY